MDDDVLRPPDSMTVEADRRVVLYDHEGRPLVRMIGFAPATTHRNMDAHVVLPERFRKREA